jgi:membrane protein
MRKYSILFDIEGTLVDSVPLSLRCWQETLADAGHPVSREALQALSGMDGTDMLEALLPEVSEKARKEILKKRGANFERDYLMEVRPFPHVRDTLRSLSRVDTALALATDCRGKSLGRYREILGIVPFIRAISCGADVPEGKPAPGILESPLRALGASPEYAVMAGDTPSDARAALRAGTASIGLLTGGFSAEALRDAGCDAVAADIATVPRVTDYIRMGVRECPGEASRRPKLG